MRIPGCSGRTRAGAVLLGPDMQDKGKLTVKSIPKRLDRGIEAEAVHGQMVVFDGVSGGERKVVTGAVGGYE